MDHDGDADALPQAASTTAILNRFASSRLQELNLQQVSARPLRRPASSSCPILHCGWPTIPAHVQLEALYSLLDDDGSGSLTVHEMIDLFVRLRPPSDNHAH